jgi:hypothetical protein
MPSNYCPSPIRLMPACPMVPSSPMTGVQTFYITMPSDAAAMFFDPNLAAVQQQHQSMMMQHAAHQGPMSPYRHIQQQHHHHQMMIGNNGTDSSMGHHPFQNAPSAFFMAAATAPPASPGGAFFQQQLASPLPFYMRPTGQPINPNQMMPGKMVPPSNAPVPVSARSPRVPPQHRTPVLHLVPQRPMRQRERIPVAMKQRPALINRIRNARHRFNAH